MLENAIGFMTWCAAIAAAVLGGAALLFVAAALFMLAWKLLTIWANKVTQRLINLYGLKAVRDTYRKLENARRSGKHEGSGDE